MNDIISHVSPFVSDLSDEINQEINDNPYEGAMKIIILAILSIILIFIIYKVFQMLKYTGEDYYQRKTHMCFDNINGESYDDNVENVITYGELIKTPRAIDHYRLGSVYLINADRPDDAHSHFKMALDQVINGDINAREANFIIDRIDDHKDRFVDFTHIGELPIQEAMLAHYNRLKEMTDTIKESKTSITGDDIKQKILLSRKHWESDGQNVHDSTIFKEITKQINLVEGENASIENNQLHTYKELSAWLKEKIKDDKENNEKIKKVLVFLSHNYKLGSIPGRNEQDIITTVWRRAYDSKNKTNFNNIREALLDNVLDCVEGDVVVCQTGRSEERFSRNAETVQ